MPAGDHLARPEAEDLHGAPARRELADQRRLVNLRQLPGAVRLALDDHRLHQAAAVGQGRVGIRQLQGRDGDDVLPDAGLRELAGKDVRAALALRPFRARDDA